MRATFSLLKKLEVASPEAYLTPSKLSEIKAIGKFDGEDGVQCTIFSQYRHEQEAKWVGLIRQHVEPGYLGWLKNRSAAALIIARVKIKDSFQFFGITLGQGHHLLNSESIERDFGKITTLNSASKVKGANSREVGTNAVQKKLASSTEVELERLGIELNYEILTGVSGQCDEKTLGSRIGGDDSLQLSSKLTLNEIGDKCRQLYAAYRTDAYKTRHPKVERMKVVKDDAKISELIGRLVKAINDRSKDFRISVAPPDLIDYEIYDEYHMSGAAQPLTEMTLESVYEMLGDRRVSISDVVERIKLQAVSANDDDVRSKREPLLAYFRYEVEEDDFVYVLSGRRWYEFSKDFVKSIRRELSDNLETYNGPPLNDWPKSLPPYPPKNSPGEIGWHEAFYNLQYLSKPDFLMMDRDNYTMGEGQGHDQIEVSDFFHMPTKMHFCVKRRHKSQTLSHLFSQGSVSADLFRRNRRYQQAFVDFVKPHHAEVDMSICDGLTFVYCLGVDRSYGEPIDALPLFSQVNLLRHSHDIIARHYRVQLCTVPLVERVDPLAPEARLYLDSKAAAKQKPPSGKGRKKSALKKS